MNARTIAAAFATLVGAAVLAVPATAKTFQIDVTITDSACKLALPAANTPNTAIDFHLINNGSAAHGLMIWGVKSHIFNSKSEGDLLVNFHKPGTYHYACTTGSYKHPSLFGKGVFKIRS
jgi:plastocyanin